MASQPGLFYAYAKNVRDDNTWRYLITFSSRQVADEWWRAVTDSVAGGYRRFAGVERVSMQWYTHDPSESIVETINDQRCAPQFHGRVMFTLVVDRTHFDVDRMARDLSIAPVLNYTDHKNGQRFFIRSILQPNLFWYYSPGHQQIRTSISQRTAFFISVVGSQGREDKIMIGSDKVSISVNRGSSLVVGDNGTEFNFSDFDGMFGRRSGGDGEMVITGQDPLGERWELVF